MLSALLTMSLLTLSQQTRPDVVVFVIDDVADSDIDAISTPNLDRLAAEGVRYRRAYAHAWCAPTRDSLAFGHWLGTAHGDSCASATTDTRDFGDFSLADLFEGAGYRTCHLGKWHTGANRVGPWEMTPHLVGFDAVRAGRPIGQECRIPGPDQTILNDGVISRSRTDDSVRQRNAFLSWWAEARGEPRFAVLNLLAGHAPFSFPPASILPAGYPRPPVALNRERFEAEVVGADFVIGQILEVIGPDTWVIFLGDNGTPGAVNGALEQSATRPDQDPEKVKLSCYEDGIRVPLIVRGPGVLAGHVSDALVHVIDILPTLSDALADAKTSVPGDGRSFYSTLFGAPGARPYVFAWNSATPETALVGERWKLLVDSSGTEMLFDLERDPREENPLPPTGPQADKLRLWRDEILTPSRSPRTPNRR